MFFFEKKEKEESGRANNSKNENDRADSNGFCQDEQKNNQCFKDIGQIKINISLKEFFYGKERVKGEILPDKTKNSQSG